MTTLVRTVVDADAGFDLTKLLRKVIKLRIRMVCISTVIYLTSLFYMVTCFAPKLEVTIRPHWIVIIVLPTLWIFVCL